MIPTVPSLAWFACSAFTIAQIPQEGPSANRLQSPPHVMQALFAAQNAEVRAVMGIVVGPVDPVLRNHLEIAESEGVVLMNVSAGQPADRAGLRQYDVLLRLDDQPIGSREDLRKVLDSKSAGDHVRAIVRRGSQEIAADVELAAPTAPSGQVSAEILEELSRQGLVDEDKRRRMLAEVEAMQNDRVVLTEQLRQREMELAARRAEMANARDHLEAELQDLHAQLEKAGDLRSKSLIEDGAARLEELRNLITQRSVESEQAAKAARDHLATLQEALAAKVDRFNSAQRLLSDRAEDLRARIEAGLFAKAKSLEQKLGADEAAALRDEAARVADEAKQALLDARDRLFGDDAGHRDHLALLRKEAEKAALFGDVARTDELRAEAESLRQRLEHEEAEHRRTVELRDSIEHRLGAIEERLARIEEMLGKLVKRDSQN